MMEKQDALVAIFTRNAFYQRFYYLVLLTFALSLVIIAILLGIIVFLIKNPVHPLYFAADKISRLIRDVSVNQPMSQDMVSQWVVEAVQAANSYDYLNYRFQLQDAQKYFVDYAWQNYLRALTASQNLVSITRLRLVMVAKVVGSPQLQKEGLLSGAYAWKYQMPVLVTAWNPPYDDKSKSNIPFLVTVTVQLQAILQSYKGLGIVQYIGETVATTQPSEISLTPTG